VAQHFIGFVGGDNALIQCSVCGELSITTLYFKDCAMEVIMFLVNAVAPYPPVPNHPADRQEQPVGINLYGHRISPEQLRTNVQQCVQYVLHACENSLVHPQRGQQSSVFIRSTRSSY